MTHAHIKARDRGDVVTSRTFKAEIIQLTDREFVESWPAMIDDAILFGDESVRGISRMMVVVRQRYALMPCGPIAKSDCKHDRKVTGRDVFEMGDAAGLASPGYLNAPRP